MSETLAVAQEQVRAVGDELTKLRLILDEIRSSLPEPPREDDEEETKDAATGLRGVIECVLHDQLEPAIRDLQAAAAFGPKAKERS
jgi:hypothetical protein